MHTATPWLQSSSILVCDKDGRILANCLSMGAVDGLTTGLEEAEANASRIVQCVNAHDELIAEFRKAAVALGANATLLEASAQGLDSTNKLRANEIRATARMLRWHADDARAALSRASGQKKGTGDA